MERRPKSAHYATGTRQKLAERSKQTKEVRDVLNGEGYKKVKPHYISKPDIRGAEVAHQNLHGNFNKLEDHDRLFGKKQNLRDQDPSMRKILAWGQYDAPVKNDFTSSKQAYEEKTKINKMGVHFITEKQDNYRDPQGKIDIDKKDRLVEYLQNENQTFIRNKIHKNLLDKDEMENFTTEYRSQTVKNNVKDNRTSKSLHSHFDNVTVAGKSRYLKPEQLDEGIVFPQEFKHRQVEERLHKDNTWNKAGWIDEHINPQL